MYNRKARINPITGEKPKQVVDPDFRITHSITAFTSLSEDVPVWYRIHEGNNDAEEFSNDVLTAIAMGFIKDVLVLDNAAYHCGKGNSVLKDWLWENHSVFLNLAALSQILILAHLILEIQFGRFIAALSFSILLSSTINATAAAPS